MSKIINVQCPNCGTVESEYFDSIDEMLPTMDYNELQNLLDSPMSKDDKVKIKNEMTRRTSL